MIMGRVKREAGDVRANNSTIPAQPPLL